MTDTPGIGHNSGPFETFGMALDDAYETAKDFLDGQPIENQGQADSVGRIVSEVKKLRKDADAARKDEKRPIDEAAAAVQAKWLPLIDRCETILKAAQAPLTAFLTQQRAEQEAEAERLRWEAARKAQEAVAASCASQGSVEAVEHARALEKDADKAAKEAARAGKAKAHVAGVDRAIGLRTYKLATVTNRGLLLKWIKQNDPEPLGAWLADYAQKALPAQLPGVTITNDHRI
jgi:hypothetical protein